MATPLLILNDIAGNRFDLSDCARNFTDTAQYFTLTANVITTVTVPTLPQNPTIAFTATQQITKNNLLVLITVTPMSSVWVQPNTTSVLALPTGVVTLTTAILNPLGFRGVVSGQEIQFLTADTGVAVSLEYYAYNPNS
jgi:hypothetical protein